MIDQDIHKSLSVSCFNKTWDFLDIEKRTAAQDREMRETAHASLFHWIQREDATPTNLSVGLWQISRVHAVLKEGETAMNYAKECIDLSEQNSLPPFYTGYGYEAAARAAQALGHQSDAAGFLKKAEDLSEQIDNAEEKEWLQKDLSDLASS